MKQVGHLWWNVYNWQFPTMDTHEHAACQASWNIYRWPTSNVVKMLQKYSKCESMYIQCIYIHTNNIQKHVTSIFIYIYIYAKYQHIYIYIYGECIYIYIYYSIYANLLTALWCIRTALRTCIQTGPRSAHLGWSSDTTHLLPLWGQWEIANREKGLANREYLNTNKKC